MSYFYDRIAATGKGARALSAARLRYQVLKALHRSLAIAGITQAELARRLGVRKSAVNQVFKGDGNLRISTLAEYLHEMNNEAVITVAPLGAQRAEAMADIDREWRSSCSVINRLPTEERDDTLAIGDIEWSPPRHLLTTTTRTFA